MKKEDVTRNGRFVRVVMGNVEREHQYSSEAAAKRAWTRLYCDKKAREKFLRTRRT